MPQLPSIQELQAFEAAARRLSFLQAAQELNVTAGAISRRLQNLEALIGAALFERRHRRVALTRKGREYLAEITDPLLRITTATAHARMQPTADVISICVYPTFAFRWLIPRWNRFYDSHPELDVRLTTSLHRVDFDREDYDLAIQVADTRVAGDLAASGAGRHATNTDLVYEKLLDIDLYPVCSPQVAARLARPEDLQRQTLLHGMPRPNDWPRWLQSAGLGPECGIDAMAGLRFSSSNLAIQAAVEGLGVVIGTEVLILEELAQGRLVKPFDLVRRSGSPFQLIYPRSKTNWQQLTWFREWLLAEAES